MEDKAHITQVLSAVRQQLPIRGIIKAQLHFIQFLDDALTSKMVPLCFVSK